MPKAPNKHDDALTEYLLAGPGRSLRSLVEIVGQKWGKNGVRRGGWLSTLERWSREEDWQTRAKEYDRAEQLKRIEEHNAAIAKMNADHAALGKGLVSLSISRFDTLVKQDVADEQAARASGEGAPRLRVSALALAQMFKTSLDLERVSRGAVTEISEQHNTGGIHIILESDDRIVDASIFEPISIAQHRPPPLQLTEEDEEADEELIINIDDEP